MLNNIKSLGGIAFLLGLLVSLILGVLVSSSAGVLALIALGIVVGVLNVVTGESVKLLLAILVLASAGAIVSQIPTIGEILGTVAGNIAIFSGSAGVPVALKIFFNVAKR